MKNQKFNKELLKEELNRFNQINEFEFHNDVKEVRPGEDPNIASKVLLSNEISEEEEESAEDELDIPDEDVNPPSEEEEGVEGEEGEEGAEGEELSDSGDEDPFGGDEEGFGGDDAGEDMEMEPEEEPLDDAVELDVTELVRGSEEAKASADSANQKIDQLMGMVDNLEGQLAGMAKISSKIDNLENEIEKRAPTPEEKIDMRSLDSYPYNIKLTDFWAEQEDQYDVMPDKDKEYVLNKKSIDADYSAEDVKDSFNTDNEYEEEDI